MKWRYVLPLLAFAALVVLLARGLSLDPREVPSPLIGKPAPQFRLPEVQDAQKFIANRDFHGQVALLSVWASWCSVCREEHPLLVDLARSRKVAIYGLNFKDTRADAQRWLKALGNPYVASGYDPDGRVGIDYGVYGVPETYVIDKHGIIRRKHIGPLTWQVLHDEILPLVERLQKEPT